MPVFQFKSATPSGDIVEGTLDAPSRSKAVEKIQSQGQLPIRVEEYRAKAEKPRYKLARRRKITQDQLTVATNELATLLKAGLPLERALSILISLSQEEALVDVLTDVREQVKGGSTLADALDSQEGVFSRFYVNLVRAGETGGALENVLERLSEHLETAKEIRDSIVSALIYPAILVFVALLSILILLTYVIPQFADLFEGAGQALPLATRITLAAGEGMQQYGWLMVLAVIGLVMAIRSQLSKPASSYRWHGWFLKLPVLGEILIRIEVARFSRTLGILLNNGVPLLKAMSIVKDTVENQVIAEGVDRVAGSLKEGQQLAEPLAENAKFPPFAVHMIRVGEESGNLEDMLLQVATLYDREIQTGIKRSLALLEPLLILVLGMIIAGVVMSILVAILGINQLVF
ncbi:MAG: type II secretion system F family protein [Candidatus Sedimenticola sp. 20ELBAFRAG]